MVLVNRDFPDAPVELSEPRGNGLILWFAGAGIFTALGLVWIAFWVPSLRTAAAEERRYLNMGGAEDDW
jgi:type II secretory pathway component PulM